MALERYRSFEPEVAPTAYVHPDASVIGEVFVGDRSSVWPTAVLRGDDGPVRVGALTSIQDGCVLHNTTGVSTTVVGDRVTVGHRAILHGCTVEDDCLIGMGAIVLDGAVVGRGSIVGAGAVVTQNKVIPPESLVLGMPAKVVRACGAREREQIETGWREYEERCREYRERDGLDER